MKNTISSHQKNNKMKKNFFLLIIALGTTLTAFCQSDKIYLHNGTVIDGTVIAVNNFTIIYSYTGEKTKSTISKYAVGKIIHGGSNREEIITTKINVNSKEDWENVVILEDKTEITGLTKVEEIEAKGGGEFGASGAQGKSLEKIKKSCCFFKMSICIFNSFIGTFSWLSYTDNKKWNCI